jgi:2-dehydropantoate 2-reductase
MRFCMVGAGAVGGYYGAKLARAGHEVTLVARGRHLETIRARGLTVRGPLGDFTVEVRAARRPDEVPPVDVAVFAVKCYSNAEALPVLRAVMGSGKGTVALTLQNGVDSADEIAATVGADRVLAGSTYIAAALVEPAVIVQTGLHRRIVFGEAFGATDRVSPRVERISAAFTEADIVSEPVADARIPVWEKFCYLAPFAAFTGAARLPIGPLWSSPDARRAFLDGVREVERVAHAEGVAVPADLVARIITYMDSLDPTTRSSLLIDLQQGKPIEVEALVGAAVRRGRRCGVPTPILSALYAVLQPHALGGRR